MNIAPEGICLFFELLKLIFDFVEETVYIKYFHLIKNFDNSFLKSTISLKSIQIFTRDSFTISDFIKNPSAALNARHNYPLASLSRGARFATVVHIDIRLPDAGAATATSTSRVINSRKSLGAI